MLLDSTKFDFINTPSTNAQYLFEAVDHVSERINSEYARSSSLSVCLINRCRQWLDLFAVGRDTALHIGCEVGRATFLLGTLFDWVVYI